MLRIALVLLIFATGFVMLTGDTTMSHLVEEKLVWAALLPGIYLLGLTLLND